MGCLKLAYSFEKETVLRCVWNREKKSKTHVNLYDYGARFYDPQIGRWMVVDPLVSEAPGWTPYRFCVNNPVNITDPTGLLETEFIDIECGKKSTIYDGKDLVIAGTTATIKAMVNSFKTNRDQYNSSLKSLESSEANLHMTSAEFSKLVESVYANNSAGVTNENKGQGVSNETLNNWNTTADFLGWGSNIWGDAAKYTLAGMKKADAATPIIKGIGIGAKTLGYTGMAISLGVDVIRYRQSPTWGNAGRIGVDGFSIGISVAWPVPGTAIGFGTAAVNATGGMEGFYNFLDANQSLYNSTGNIMVPGLNPFNPLTIIKLK